MNREKVKEIKARLQEAIEYCARELEKDLFQKSLTLINELESDNTFLRDMIKRFRKENTTLYNDIYKKVVKDIGKESQKLKDRIAELEKELSERFIVVATKHANVLNEIIENAIKETAKKILEVCVSPSLRQWIFENFIENKE